MSSPAPPDIRTWAMRASLGVAVLMLAGKLTAFFMTGSTAILSDAAFEYLDGPIRRVAAPDAAGVPFSAPLEDAYLPQTEDIRRACSELAAY